MIECPICKEMVEKRDMHMWDGKPMGCATCAGREVYHPKAVVSVNVLPGNIYEFRGFKTTDRDEMVAYVDSIIANVVSINWFRKEVE
jgi:hypothetical protein